MIKPSPRRFLNVFLLALLNLSVMTSLRNLPIVSEYGFASITLYVCVAIAFLFPSALVSAELATGWNRPGGVYVWVREAFGPKWGFFAIWMQWIHNVTWFPAILSFSATTLAYLINPALASNSTYLISFILVGFWSVTFFNLFGLKTSSWFSALGVIAGTIIPGILLLCLGIAWYVGGHPIQIPLTASALIPPLHNIQNLVFIAGLFLAFGGLEVSAAHAKEVQNPQRDYPRSILLAAVVSLLIYALGALSIAIIIPRADISLVAGLMEAFQRFLPTFGLEWALGILALMIVYGAIGELNAWIIGPVRGLHATSKHGDLPPVFQKLNKRGIPANLLFFQGAIVTVATFAFHFMPSASSAFWILSAMSAQLYLVMYFLMFLAAIKLRYSHPQVIRAYRIPYHMPGIWIVAGFGAISSLFGFCLGFVPPGQLDTGSLLFYECFLGIGIAAMSFIPVLIYKYRNPSWRPHNYEP